MSVERRRLLQMIVASGGAVTAGCLGGDDTGDGGTETDTEAPETTQDGAQPIEVWGWDVAGEALDLSGDFFGEQFESEVEAEVWERPTMKAEVLETFDTGSDYPEVTMVESIDAPAWIATDGLRDISEWIEADGIRDQYVEGKWEALSDEEGIYALPWDLGPVVILYRRTVFDDHGIEQDDIETWADFLDAGERLPANQSLLNVPPNDYNGFWRVQFRQLGGEPFTDDGAVNIHSGKGIRAARTLREITDSGLASTYESWSPEWFDALGDASIASIISGSWMEGTLRSGVPETAGDWGMMKPPAQEPGGSRATNWGGSNLAIPAAVDDETARTAWEFIKFTCGADMQLRIFDSFGIFPANEETYGEERLVQENDFFGGQRVGELLGSLADDIPGYRFTPDTPVVSTAVNEHLTRLVDGETTPEGAMQAAAEQVASETGRDLA
jgi:ABC-type glycerol-3-phosphate transport system substrate-binding protein